MNRTLGRHRRRGAGRRRRDRDAAGPSGAAGALRRPVTTGQRHAVHPRPDARRRPATAKWGLLDAVVAAGTPPVRRTVFHYGAEQFAVSLKPAAGIDALYAPRRTVLDALLVDAAVRAGATVEFGTPVVGLCRDGRRSGDRGPAATIAAPRRVRAEYAALVVGADGRDSLVAREVGATDEFTGRHAGSTCTGTGRISRPTVTSGSTGRAWPPGPSPPMTARPACSSAQPRHRIEAAVDAAGSPAAAIDGLADQIGLGERMRSAHRIGAVRYVRSLPPGYLRTAQGPGWALVGDAGHWMDPISTHGMTSALRDAELLAEPCSPARVARRASALGSYQPTRDRLSLPMLHVTGGNRLLPVGSHAYSGVVAHPVLGDDGRVEALTALDPVA